MKKRAIISFGNNRGNYRLALARLEQSLKGNFDGDFFGFKTEAEINAPPHKENPYAFKIYAIEVAKLLGYEQILYLDSSAYAIKDITPIFNVIDKEGYFMQAAGHYVGTWCNDFTLNYFDLPRSKADAMPMFSAGFTGLDFTDRRTKEFFAQWKESMLAGCFKGDWTNHRHDMTCGSIIANRLHMKYQGGDRYIQYGKPSDALINDSIVMKCQGL